MSYEQKRSQLTAAALTGMCSNHLALKKGLGWVASHAVMLSDKTLSELEVENDRLIATALLNHELNKHLAAAWQLIAGVGYSTDKSTTKTAEPGWSQQTTEWRQKAAEWRDKYQDLTRLKQERK